MHTCMLVLMPATQVNIKSIKGVGYKLISNVMKPKKNLIGVIIILMVMTQCIGPKNYPVELDQLVPGSSLIFKAKIVLLNTVTTDEDDVDNAGVVVVTEVIDAPENLQNISGQQVTVRFTDISQIKVNEERLFFTDPYWIGESLGVKEKGSVMKSDKLYEDEKIFSYIKQARLKQDDVQLSKILNISKLVISGKVVKVNEIKGNASILTEHDPQWKVAEIQIDKVIKGKAEGQTIKVLFASSKDVLYFQSPKFKINDEGVFIIQQADPQTTKNFLIENMVKESKGFIMGNEKVSHIKSLIK